MRVLEDVPMFTVSAVITWEESDSFSPEMISDPDIWYFQKEEQQRREDLDSILKENQTKIEEQHRKMVRVLEIEIVQLYLLFKLGWREVTDDRGANENRARQAEVKAQGREESKERAEKDSRKKQLSS